MDEFVPGNNLWSSAGLRVLDLMILANSFLLGRRQSLHPPGTLPSISAVSQ